MNRRYDAVIVGSGFGGGVTACRLAEAGWKVCVLERGAAFPDFSPPANPGDALDRVWSPRLNPEGMLEIRPYRDLYIVSAAGVGGGSLVYANVQLRAKPDVFQRGWPADVTRAELDPYYDRVEEVLQPRHADATLDRPRALAKLASLAGLSAKPAPLAVHFDPARRRFGRDQEPCQNEALCDVGCRSRAKNSIDVTYLARAVNCGADVRPLHEVVDLTPPNGDGQPWRVGFRKLGRGLQRPRGLVEAPLLVLAAGALGSTSLLLNNRRRLPALSDTLGLRFGGNGNALAMLFEPRAEGVSDPNSHKAPVITTVMDLWPDHRFIIEDGALPKGLLGFFDIIDTLNNHRNPRSLLLLLKRAGAYLGLSDSPVTRRAFGRGRLKAHLDTFNGHPVEDTLVFLLVGDEEPNKRVLKNHFGRIQVKEANRSEQNRALFAAMLQKMELLKDKADAEDAWLPIGKFGPLGKFITVHPLGGCAMADSPDDGVVDSFGRVHGYRDRRFYVLDGSILPTAAGTNPAMTIAALAERGAEQILVEGKPPQPAAQNGLADTTRFA